MSIDIPRNERGVIRVFAVNRNPEEVTRSIEETDKAAVASDLLNRTITENGIELFPLADLTGVGLPGYLKDGYAVEAEQLAAHRARLEALEGYVLLVFSEAFDGEAVTLEPGSDLTFVGSFGETQADMRSQPIDSEAAQPYTGVPRQTPATPPKGRPGSVLVAVAVGVLAVLILWWLFS